MVDLYESGSEWRVQGAALAPRSVRRKEDAAKRTEILIFLARFRSPLKVAQRGTVISRTSLFFESVNERDVNEKSPRIKD